jgi:hypothetical protein
MVTSVRASLRAGARAWGIEPAARLALARTAWPQIVGPTLARVSAPVSLRGGRLLVGVRHPSAAQEIRLRGGAIIRALVRHLEEDVVTEVVPVARRHLSLVGTPSPAPKARRVSGGRRR